MRFSILFLFILFSNFVSAQTFQVGHRSLSFNDPARSNRSLPTEIYYPANTNGNGVPLASGTEKFAVVTFGHGFVMPYSAYGWLADSLVKYGYILAFPTTESSFSPNHLEFGKDIAFLCQRITSLNDSAASFLFGRVLNKSAAAGHSMGGGAGFLAMTYNTNINALFNFSAAETTPSAKTAALSVQRPALLFAGTADCIVPDSNQLRMYNNIPYTCKTFIDITDALHCHFGNNDLTCSFGQITSGCNNSPISAPVVFNKVQTMLLPFLDYYLKGICTRGTDFENAYNTITGVTKQRTCSSDPYGCVTTGIIDLEYNKQVRIMPNPLNQFQTLKITSKNKMIKTIIISDPAGRQIYWRSDLNKTEWTIKNIFIQKGLYIITVINNDIKAAVKKVLVN